MDMDLPNAAPTAGTFQHCDHTCPTHHCQLYEMVPGAFDGCWDRMGTGGSGSVSCADSAPESEVACGSAGCGAVGRSSGLEAWEPNPLGGLVLGSLTSPDELKSS